MDRSTSFTRLMTHLPDATLITYDRRGYGKSATFPPSEEFSVQVDDLLEVLDGQPVAAAFGHSFGGDVVLAAAERAPAQFASLVVWEPPAPWEPWWPSSSTSRGRLDGLAPEEMAEAFMRRMVGDRIWERLPAATREQRRGEGATLAAEMRSLAAGAPFDPAAIEAPALAGYGPRSRAHQKRNASQLAGALRRGSVVTVAEAHHGVHLSHPAELAELIREAANRSHR